MFSSPLLDLDALISPSLVTALPLQPDSVRGPSGVKISESRFTLALPRPLRLISKTTSGVIASDGRAETPRKVCQPLFVELVLWLSLTNCSQRKASTLGDSGGSAEQAATWKEGGFL